MRRLFRRGVLILLGIGLLWQAWYLSWVVLWKYTNPHMTHFMEIHLAQLRAKRPRAELVQQWLPYRRISPELKRAVVASEDARFVDDDGFDWRAMRDALVKDEKKGKVVAGGSTISQQLAKNLFLSPERTLGRKIQEALITVMLETIWGKRRILEVYLNVVEWGKGIFGAEAAARHYYGISAARLSAAQAARLAVMLPDPEGYGSHPYSPYLDERTRVIERRMRLVKIP